MQGLLSLQSGKANATLGRRGKFSVNYRTKIHSHIHAAADELLAFVRRSESSHQDHWVPAVQIKDALELNFVAVPQQGKQYGPKGWLFAILARILEDQGRLEHKKVGSRAFFRTKAAS
jgi:hypothetical protein